MTDLRTRIAAAIQPFLFDRYDCPIPSEAGEVADAVIRELVELTQPVSVEPIGDYQYLCHRCGSSFSFYSSSTMQQFALMHSGSHNQKHAHA